MALPKITTQESIELNQSATPEVIYNDEGTIKDAMRTAADERNAQRKKMYEQFDKKFGLEIDLPGICRTS